MATPRIDAQCLQQRLAAGAELALLDVREQGVHYRGHPFFACCAPLSHLELRIHALVPRLSVPIVLLDAQEEGLAERAARVLANLGYTQIEILAGGCAGWREAGFELFSGVNVPSKAFGEFVEHHDQTPRIAADELRRKLAAGENLIIVDSRPYDEYHRMNIPGAIDVPGAELAWRVHELAPDPATLVVVNCAGRTRSIIGCQSLRNVGIANPVVALKDGTMGWDLAGLNCERGATRTAPAPSATAAAHARSLAAELGQRFELDFVNAQTVRQWQHDQARTLYLLDVRSPAEYEAGHIAGSRHAPGGQLVQATDEYLAVRSARIVLIDPEQVRAIMTASWLKQMGLPDVHVLDATDFVGWPMADGPQAFDPSCLPPGDVDLIEPGELAARLAQPGLAVLNLASSLRHRARHIPGAWWVVRARLEQAREHLPDGLSGVVLSADDPAQAQLAAPEAAAMFPNLQVQVLAGGNAGWFDAGLASEQGLERATTTFDDVWYKPYDHLTDYDQHARAYLDWEVALVEQIRRDPTIRFQRFERRQQSGA